MQADPDYKLAKIGYSNLIPLKIDENVNRRQQGPMDHRGESLDQLISGPKLDSSIRETPTKHLYDPIVAPPGMGMSQLKELKGK